jgi:hypothetical protein
LLWICLTPHLLLWICLIPHLLLWICLTPHFLLWICVWPHIYCYGFTSDLTLVAVDMFDIVVVAKDQVSASHSLLWTQGKQSAMSIIQ